MRSQKYSELILPGSLPPGRSIFLRELQGAAQGAFGALFKLVADGPVILPNQILRVLCSWIDQHQRALKIVHQGFVGFLGQVGKQSREQPNGLVGVSFGVQKDEGFAQIDVFGAVDIKLTHHHEAAKDQQGHEKQKELVLPQKSHRFCLWHGLCRSNGNRNLRADEFV